MKSICEHLQLTLHFVGKDYFLLNIKKGGKMSTLTDYVQHCTGSSGYGN
jgi:hypothetical protein